MISLMLSRAIGVGSRRRSSTLPCMPGHPSFSTVYPCARYRSAQLSKLCEVIHNPWINTTVSGLLDMGGSFARSVGS